MNTGRHEERNTAVFIIILLFIAFLLLSPGTGAVAADSGRQADVQPASPNHNMTNVSSEDTTVPEHRPDLVLINGQIELRETLLPAPKGDLAVGPRRIDLVFLAGVVLIVGAITAVSWYILKRKPDEESAGTTDEDTEREPVEDVQELDPDLQTPPEKK